MLSRNKHSARYSEKPWRGRPEPDFGWAASLERQLRLEWQRGKTVVDTDKKY